MEELKDFLVFLCVVAIAALKAVTIKITTVDTSQKSECCPCRHNNDNKPELKYNYNDPHEFDADDYPTEF